MAKIVDNLRLSEDFFLMKVAHKDSAEMGQFYMLRAWEDQYPLLSRPISIFDIDKETVSFLYKPVGKGTHILSELKKDDDISLLGPNGNGFPQVKGRVALVGGGLGIAPFYLTAKRLKEYDPGNLVDVYLGFSGTPVFAKEYEEVADSAFVNVGGFITDCISPEKYDYIFTCGPEIMMKALYNKCCEQGVGERLYVSLEERMVCGFGICVCCVVRIKSKGSTDGFEHKKVCTDGPVFRCEEVVFNEQS